ncbi:hypothetical protein Acr_23g0011750 [Actinidia rufa]|uniref:Uncharacterized protein n=1 Tax=Actinidia rufa TaxID=165716 RepID=A0A7J0GPP7_9ERIC|nr:hypothetical protein Acr_23g0011750 [Actinidia rufa]
MELNRAQLLGHDDEALKRFKAKHGIPADVHIECPVPNEAGLGFPICSMLKELMAYYCLTFIDRFKRRSENYTKAIQVANNKKASRKVSDILQYEPIYWHVIPHKAEESKQEFQPRHSPFRARRTNTLTTLPMLPYSPRERLKLSIPLESLTTRAQAQWKLICQAPLLAIDQILALIDAVMGVSPSSSEAPLSNKRKGKKTMAGPSRRSKKRTEGTSFALLPSSDADVGLWKPKFPTVELDRQIIVADSAKDRDTSLALARAIMLPKDITNLVEESSNAIRDLLVMQQVQFNLKRAKKRMNSLESKLNKVKLALSTTDQLKLNLVAVEHTWDANYLAATQAQNEVVAARAERDKALKDLAELEVMAYGPVYERVFKRGINRAGDNYDSQVAELPPRIYMEGWLTFLVELGIPKDNLAWSKATPTAELPDSPKAYSPMILLDFNEEEFMNWPDEEDGIEVPVNDKTTSPIEETAPPAKETRKIATEEVVEDVD